MQLSFDYVVFNILAPSLIPWEKTSLGHLRVSNEFFYHFRKRLFSFSPQGAQLFGSHIYTHTLTAIPWPSITMCLPVLLDYLMAECREAHSTEV